MTGKTIVALTLAMLGWSSMSWAQATRVPQSQKGRRTAPILLLCREEIQKELSLSPEVIAQATSLAADLQRRAAALRGKTGSGVLMTRRTIDLEQTRWLNNTLSKDQLDRLHQLDLQWEGPTAFVSRPIIAEYLSITPQQREAMINTITAHAKSSKAQASPDSEEALNQKILGGLSEQQRRQWIALLGKPFMFRPDPQIQDSRLSRVKAETKR